MLQSPSKRIQRHRLSSTFENSLLEAKQQYALPASPIQKRTLQRNQHRRQLSVPDEALLLKSSMKVSEAFTLNQDQMGSAFGIFTVTEQAGPQHQQQQHQQHSQAQGQDFDRSWKRVEQGGDYCSAYGTVTPQQQPTYYQFPRTQHQHVRKGSMDSMQALAQRRGSLLNPAAHVRSATGGARTIEEITGILSQDIFDHGPPRPSVSTFDMAPLPHPRYVNLSSLAMGGSPESSEMDDSFYSHSPLAMSPGFPPHDLQAQMAMYESLQQHGVGVSDLASSSSPVMSAQASCHTHNASGRPLLAPAPSVPNETAPLERADAQMLLNGITMEEIAGFISGPEPNDGKWVCLYDGCAKRFGRKENIKSHVQTHLGDRQFKCQVCKKCFVRQHDLKRHSKIHTGVKPYPCLCGNSFARHDALTRHRQRGMCVGAFEGVVRKEVKRGRPRKKPLPKEDGTSVCGASSSAASDSSRETPPPGQDVEDGSASPSPDAESPCGMPEMGSSDEYTPPTSPSYDAESYAAADKATFDGFNAEPYMTGDPTDFNTPRKGGVSPYNAPGGDFGSSVDMSMFTDDIMGLTALERDPTILSYSYIKPELHEAPETNFYTDVNC